MKMIKKTGIALCGILVVYALFSMAYSEDTVTNVIETGVKVVPQVISLNSQNTGTQQNIKANLEFTTLYRTLGEHDIQFMIGDDVVAESESLIWAWTHMEVGFDRATIIQYATKKGLEGEIEVTIAGSFVGYNDDGVPSTYTFTGSDQVLFK